MFKICHRINTTEQLKNIHITHGVELDLRAFGDRIVVHHDAFSDAVDFEDWLKCYKHSFVVLNIKEEGIENIVRELVSKYHVHDYFMLDLSFPAMIRMIRTGEKRVAIRVSHYESVDCALSLAGKIDWVWLDLFHDHFPIDRSQYHLLQKARYKICLVSPELHGRNRQSITTVQNYLVMNQLTMDAVCTKHPELW